MIENNFTNDIKEFKKDIETVTQKQYVLDNIKNIKNNKQPPQRKKILEKRNYAKVFVSKPNVLTKKSTYVCLGKINQLFLSDGIPKVCQNPSQCLLLKKITAFFISNWTKAISELDESEHRLLLFLSPTDNEQTVEKLNEEISKIKCGSPNNLFHSNELKRFLINPVEFLKNKTLFSMGFSERLLAIYSMVRKNCLLALPNCFCSKQILACLKNYSPKRCYDLKWVFIKKYMELIKNKERPKYFLCASRKKRNEWFNNFLSKNFKSKKFQEMFDSYYVKNRSKKKGKIFRSMHDFLDMMQDNEVMAKYFTKQYIMENWNLIQNCLMEEQLKKVDFFLEKFKSLDANEIFCKLIGFVKNKKSKIFMNCQDIFLVLEVGRGMMRI
jgi:hypothetical protein